MTFHRHRSAATPRRSRAVAVRMVLLLAALLAAAWLPATGRGRAEAPTLNGAATANETVMTPWGPLGPVDRDLLVRVRTAGLWEAPTGEQAQQRAGATRVKEVGAILATDHHGLDDQTRATAARLNVPLPDKPTAEQQGWMAELSTKTGTDYDKTFTMRLRAAHGKVFAIASSVRAGTRNDVMRAFATTAVNIVMKHMSLLESTGQVDYSSLPPPQPAASTSAGVGGTSAVRLPRESVLDPVSATRDPGGGVNRWAIWLVLAAAAAAGTVATYRMIRPK